MRPGGWWRAREASPSNVNCSVLVPCLRLRQIPKSGSSSDSSGCARPPGRAPATGCPSQISIREKTPATTTSRSRPAYSRRCCGIATRPCLSGVTRRRRRRTTGRRRAPARPRFEASRTRSRHLARTPAPCRRTGSRPSPWSRRRHPTVGRGTSTGRITRPLASRECWYSPRNIWLPRPSVAAPRTANRSPVLHFAPPYAPLPHSSTLSPHRPPALTATGSPMVRAPHGRPVRRPAPLIRPSPGSPRCARLGLRAGSRPSGPDCPSGRAGHAAPHRFPARAGKRRACVALESCDGAGASPALTRRAPWRRVARKR